MPAKRSSTNISTALAAVTSPFGLLRCGRFPCSKRSHSNVLGTATLVLLTLLAFSVTPTSRGYAATTRTVCASGCGYTTIAAAIAAANAGDTVSIQDTVHSGETNITVNKNLTIQGQGAANTAVDGGARGSVFIINGGVTATIQDVAIRNGSAFLGGGIYNNGTATISNITLSGNSAGNGGGIFNGIGSTVTISNSTLSGNSATSGLGGGISNAFSSTANISNSTLSGNSAPYGGGIVNFEGTANISNSTLSGNSATYDGGGIFNLKGMANISTFTLSDSTLSGNSASVYGGGIYNTGTVTLSNSTLSGNSASVYGGGIYNVGIGSTVTISNSTLSGNSAPGGGSLANFNAASVKNSIVGNSSGGDCYGTITALGANLDTDGSCGGFTTVTPAQLNLGPLVLNAPGTTETLALLPPSAAINAAPDCKDVSGNSVTTDQRGVTRPDGGESACDIGAFELVDQALFASFSVNLSLQFNQGLINLNSAFTLGAGSDGLSPLTEAVAVQVGNYSTKIPAGSFRQKSNGSFMFVGTINGVSISAKITPQGGNNYTFQFTCTGANLTGTVNPVTVTLMIGDDAGTISVIA